MGKCGGEVLLDLLQNYGIEYIFCSPGSEWVPVWNGLSDRYSRGDESLKYINCRHESLAVCAAIGYTKMTGKLPAVLLHTGVGTLHGAMAIRNAYITQHPMIIFSAEDSDHGEDAAVKPMGGHWISHLADIGGPDALIRPCVKWSNAVRTKDTLIDSVYRACHMAQTAPRGPVFIAVSRELLFKPLSEAKYPPLSPIAGLPEVASNHLEEVAQGLIDSKQPIIVTEHAGKNPEAIKKLTELAELLAIPVFESTDPRFGNFPRNSPMHMGFNVSGEFRDSDTVFVVGATVPWYPPASFPKDGAKVIFLDEAPLKENLPFWGVQPDLLLTADIHQCLTTLTDMIREKINESVSTGSNYQERFERLRNSHNKMVEKWKDDALADQNKKPVSPRWFFHTLNKMLPTDSIIVEETITYGRHLKPYLLETNRFIRAVYGGLGMGFGEATGVKIASGDRPVVFIVGDGTFNYNPVIGGLGLCQEYHLPILIIVLNNGGYISMSGGYHREFPEGWAATHKKYLGVDILPRPEYSKLADAFDAYGEKIEDPGDVEPAMKRALEQLAQGKTVLLDVILDRA